MKKPLGIKQWVLYCVAAPVALWLGITFVVNRYFTYDIDKTFPSPGFRSVVLSYLDLNHDGKLSRSEAGKVTELHLDNMDDLCDLRGIEVFRNLEELDCRYGYLTELNLSGNPKLTRLDCSYNILSRLDLRANRKLKKVVAQTSVISEILLSKKNQVEWLDVSDNILSDLANVSDKPTTEIKKTEKKAPTKRRRKLITLVINRMFEDKKEYYAHHPERAYR